MNDQQDPQPEPPGEPPPDDGSAKAATSLGESTPIRVISSAFAYLVTCLIAAVLVTVVAFVAMLLFGVASTRGAGALIESVVTVGFSAVATCWLGMLVCFVLLNSYVQGDRRGIIRRSGVLGAISGLIASVIPMIHLMIFKEGREGSKLLAAMPYVIAGVVLLICLIWMARQSGSDDQQPEDDDSDEDDHPNGSEE